MSSANDTNFDFDQYPGKPKILFIGLAESSHTHAWLDLLDGPHFNVRLFAIPTILPPDDLKTRTYIAIDHLKHGMDLKTRLCLYPLPEEVEDWEQRKRTRLRQLKYNPLYLLFRLLKKSAFMIGRLIKYPYIYKETSFNFTDPAEIELQKKFNKNLDFLLNPPQMRASSPEEWLANIIQEWQPDIIHTLGMNDNQGGEFFFSVRQNFHLQGIGKWVLQLRGGSDLALRHYDPNLAPHLYEIMMSSDYMLTDNLINIEYAQKIGVPENKFAPIGIVSGTGGIEVDKLRQRYAKKTSQRARVVVIPKAYESVWSKCLPILDAIKISWSSIKPCRFIFTASTEEIRNWIHTLPADLQDNCDFLPRIKREDFLDLIGNARVLVAPSLIDGIPETLHEAMACGTFPIFSPLITLKNVFLEYENVLFARNLYPDEIANALIRAMTDDKLVDEAFEKNYLLALRLADRAIIKRKVIDFYNSLVEAH